jgi:hypothetical protein
MILQDSLILYGSRVFESIGYHDCASLAYRPFEVRFVLGDRHYNREEMRDLCTQDGRCLVTTQYGRYPHTDDGVEVRRTFHKLRSVAIENFKEHFAFLKSA